MKLAGLAVLIAVLYSVGPTARADGCPKDAIQVVVSKPFAALGSIDTLPADLNENGDVIANIPRDNSSSNDSWNPVVSSRKHGVSKLSFALLVAEFINDSGKIIGMATDGDTERPAMLVGKVKTIFKQPEMDTAKVLGFTNQDDIIFGGIVEPRGGYIRHSDNTLLRYEIEPRHLNRAGDAMMEVESKSGTLLKVVDRHTKLVARFGPEVTLPDGRLLSVDRGAALNSKREVLAIVSGRNLLSYAIFRSEQPVELIPDLDASEISLKGLSSDGYAFGVGDSSRSSLFLYRRDIGLVDLGKLILEASDCKNFTPSAMNGRHEMIGLCENKTNFQTALVRIAGLPRDHCQ